MQKRLSLLFLFFSINLSAQISISGTVLDSQNKPLEFASAALQDTLTKEFIKVNVTDEKGEFSLQTDKTGAFQLSIQFLAYETRYFSDFKQTENKLGKIILEKSAVDLGVDVTVTAERNAIVNENGNLRVTIAGSIFATQPNAMEVLSSLPKMMVSNDRESISIIGQGTPLIYLGNQRISVQELNAIPVEEIKDIQIINNPSAKYEANGRAVLLITRLANLANGYKISLSENATFRRHFNNYAGINSSFKRNKLELKANFNFNRLHMWEGSETEFTVLNEDFYSKHSGFYHAPRPQFIFGAGLYYQLNKDDYISVNANTRLQSDGNPILTDTQVDIAEQSDRIETINNVKGERSFFSSNFNYFKKLKASSIFFGMQFTDYVRGNSSDISNNLNETEFVAAQMRDQRFHIDSWTARLNFEKNFTEDFKWELGTNISKAQADAFAEFIFPNVSDDNFETNYDYSEITYAAYSQLSGKSKKLTYSAGVRAENNIVTAGFREADSLLVDRNRLVVFPRASLSVALDSTKTLTFNYLKSINRPHYLNATTITTFINPYYEYSRNINLISAISRSFSVNFQWKQQSLTARVRQVENPFQTSIRYVEGENRVIAQPDNFDQEIQFSFFYTNPIRYKFLTSTNTAGLLWAKIEDPRAALISISEPYFYLYSNNQFKIAKKHSIGFNIWALSRQRKGVISTEPIMRIGLFASTTLFEKLQVSLNCNDIFRGGIWENRTQVNDISNRTTFFGDSRSFALSLKYSFGKILKSTYKNEDVDDNLRRIN